MTRAKPKLAKPLLKPLPKAVGSPATVDPLQPTQITPKPIEPPAGAGPSTTKLPLGPAPVGRPVSNIGRYLIKPTDNTLTGFEMLNDKPDMIKQVHERFLKQFQLPPALQPKYLRKPEVLDQGRAKNISRGWRKPRSQQG